MHISLRERGEDLLVGPEASDQEVELLRELSGLGVVKIRSVAGNLLVSPRQYVGVCRWPLATVEVLPRHEGLFKVLKEWFLYSLSVAPDKKREEANGDEETETQWTTAFLESVRRLTQDGIPLVSQFDLRETSCPRGKTQFRESINRFWSRRQFHRAVCLVDTPEWDEDIIKAIGYTARSLLDEKKIEDGTAGPLELLAGSFPVGYSATRDVVLQGLDRAGERYRGNQAACRFITVAQAILRAEATLWEVTQDRVPGAGRFANMDRVWERAIAGGLMHEAVGDKSFVVQLHPYSASEFRIPEPAGASVDPDIVVSVDSKRIMLDAKYSLQATFVADDVYQIIAYIEATNASGGVLAYLTTQPEGWVTRLGRLGEGETVCAVGIPVNDFRNGIARLRAEILSATEH